MLDCDQTMRSLDAQATQPVGDTATPETTDREQTVEITLGPMSVRSGDRSSRWAPLFASRQPRRVTAPGLPVMCLRMVSAWQPAATACLAICRAYHTSDMCGRRCFSAR